MVRSTVGGHKETGGPRIPSCPGSLSAASVIVIEGPATQASNVITQALSS